MSTHRSGYVVRVYLAAALLCALALLPATWAVFSSLKPLDEVYAFPPRFVPSEPQWHRYFELGTRLPIGRFLLNSLLIAGCAVPGAVLTSSMAGFALARGGFRGRALCFVLVIASMALPAQAFLVSRFLIFEQLGWVNTYKPLIVPAWLGGGAFNIFLFRQFFLSIPRSFDDAAYLDGATHWQVYWLVLLPMVRPAVATAALLSFVFHWQEFLDPLIYLSDFSAYPISLGLRMFQSISGTWANLLMAASIVALLPVILLFIVFQRVLMTGLGLFSPIDP